LGASRHVLLDLFRDRRRDMQPEPAIADRDEHRHVLCTPNARDDLIQDDVRVCHPRVDPTRQLIETDRLDRHEHLDRCEPQRAVPEPQVA
jgi:hypothetical protein